jgi:hypothetical protein
MSGVSEFISQSMLHPCAALILLDTCFFELNNPLYEVACCAEPCTRAAGFETLVEPST